MEEATQMDISTASFSPCTCSLCTTGDQLGTDSVRDPNAPPHLVEVQGDPELSYWSFDRACSGLRRILRDPN